jgi:hypothetical protein
VTAGPLGRAWPVTASARVNPAGPIPAAAGTPSWPRSRRPTGRLAGEQVAAAVGAVAGHGAALRSLAAVLAEGRVREVLACGAPPVVGRLVTELISRGSAVFVPPSCAACGRIGLPLTRSGHDGGASAAGTGNSPRPAPVAVRSSRLPGAPAAAGRSVSFAGGVSAGTVAADLRQDRPGRRPGPRRRDGRVHELLPARRSCSSRAGRGPTATVASARSSPATPRPRASPPRSARTRCATSCSPGSRPRASTMRSSSPTAATPPASPWRCTPASPSPTSSSATTTSSATSPSDPPQHARLRLVTRFLPGPQRERVRRGFRRLAGSRRGPAAPDLRGRPGRPIGCCWLAVRYARRTPRSLVRSRRRAGVRSRIRTAGR